MANFQLTPAQKSAVQHFHKIGNMHGFSWNTIQALINKGIIEQFDHDTMSNRYDLLRYTSEGQAWADVMFGDSTPEPTSPAPVADETSEIRFVVEAVKHLQYRIRDTKTGEFASTPRKIYTNYALACAAAKELETSSSDTSEPVADTELSDWVELGIIEDDEDDAESDFVTREDGMLEIAAEDDIYPDPDPLPVVAEGATPVAPRYLVINRVIDTETMECEDIDETLSVLYELREDGESLVNWLVQEWQGDSLIESVFAQNWYADNVTPHKAGDIVDIMGVQYEVQSNGILKQLPPAPVQPAITWLKREDLHPYVNVQFSFGVQRVFIPQPTRYFNERMGYTYLQDREETPKLPSKTHKSARKVQCPNMQRRNAPAPVKVAKREPLRETVLEIVSRIQTPLAPQTERRVA